MCIQEFRIFRCPTRYGTQAQEHVDKHNILCGAHTPCPKPLWERRALRYRSSCPACSGQSSAIPLQDTAFIDITKSWWVHDRQEHLEEQWAERYVSSWADFMCLAVYCSTVKVGDKTKIKEWAKVYNSFSSLVAEVQCKEHPHAEFECGCDANASHIKRFLRNPASAARYRTIMRESEGMREWAPKLEHAHNRRTPLGPGQPERWDTFAEKLMQEKEDRQKGFPFSHRVAGSNRPIWDEQWTARRSVMEHVQLLALVSITDKLEKAPEMPDGPLQQIYAQSVKRRCLLYRCLGEMMREDVGISDERFLLAMQTLAELILDPTLRKPSGMVALERLAQMANEILTGPEPVSLTALRDENRKWVTELKVDWHEKEVAYHNYQFSFAQWTKQITGQKLETALEAQEACPICKTPYFEADHAAESVVKPSPDASAGEPQACSEKWAQSGGGEAPVEVKECGHVFGTRCLFLQWVGKGLDASRLCPVCRGSGEGGGIVNSA